MQGEHTIQSSLLAMICDDLIPPYHLLCKLTAAVNLGFVGELVSDCYCPDNGCSSWDPLVLFKVVFLLFDKLRVVSNVEPQFLYDLSDREIEEQVNLTLACKWFTRLQPEEAAPPSPDLPARSRSPFAAMLSACPGASRERLTLPSAPRCTSISEGPSYRAFGGNNRVCVWRSKAGKLAGFSLPSNTANGKAVNILLRTLSAQARRPQIPLPKRQRRNIVFNG